MEEADFQNPTGNRQVEAEDVGAVDGGRVDPSDPVEVALPVGEDTWERDGKVLSWKRLVQTGRERRLENSGARPRQPAHTRLTLHPLLPPASIKTLVTRVTVLSFGSFFSHGAISAVLPVRALTPPLFSLTPLLPIQTRNAWFSLITSFTLQTFGSNHTLDSR